MNSTKCHVNLLSTLYLLSWPHKTMATYKIDFECDMFGVGRCTNNFSTLLRIIKNVHRKFCGILVRQVFACVYKTPLEKALIHICLFSLFILSKPERTGRAVVIGNKRNAEFILPLVAHAMRMSADSFTPT